MAQKTLFFSISNPQMLRNFALVPCGVLDILSQEKHLKIVILTWEENRGKEGVFYHSGPAEVIFEFVAEDRTRSLVENLFAFFYSYLLFTDTTRLVSSYGVRSDKPRPWWRFYNYLPKLFFGKVLGRSVWIKKTLVPKLYHHLLRRRPYRYVFEKYQPALVFLPNLCLWPTDLEFVVEAQRSCVTSVGMPGNWDHLSKYFIPFRSDVLLVWSDETGKEAVEYQLYVPQKVREVGAPQVDFFIRSHMHDAREAYLQSMQFPADTFLISYASAGPYSVDGPDYIDMMLHWIDEKQLPSNSRIIIRIHPKALAEEERFARFEQDPRIHIDRTEGWTSIENAKNYNNFMAHADVIVTTYSSVATEASVWDRPTIITSFDGYKIRPMYQSVRRHRAFTHFKNVIATGGVRISESPDELLRWLQEYRRDPSQDKKERALLVAEVFGPADGKSAGRVAGAIMDELGKTKQ